MTRLERQRRAAATAVESRDKPVSDGLRRALVSGVVDGPDGEPHVFIGVGEERAIAAVAASCLLMPAEGDTVLLADSDGEIFVLAVLKRASGPAHLAVPGASSVRLDAPDLHLAARASLRLEAPDLDVSGDRARVKVDETRLIGRLASGVVKTLELVSDRVRSVARQVTQSADTRVTSIGRTDTLKASVLVQEIDTSQIQHARQTVMVSEEDTHIDAKRITMG